MLLAKDIMTTDVITVTPETTVEKLAALLWENRISGAPVVDDKGTLISVVTESDLIDQTKKIHIPTAIAILDSFFYLENPKKMEKEIQKITAATVKDICAKDLVSVNEETQIDEIATIMAEKGVHTLPVVKEGALVGVIGKTDIIKTLAKSNS